MAELIDRQDVTDIIQKMYESRPLDSDRWIICDFRTKVESLPTVEERKKGEWIEIPHNQGITFQCSVCGQTTPTAKTWDIFCNEYDYPFCPRCGADMRGNDND